jgi:hypothetical protein
VILFQGRVVAASPMADLRAKAPGVSLEQIFSEAVALEDPARAADELASLVSLGT